MTKQQWIKYNHMIIDDKPNEADKQLEDIFNQYHIDREDQLLGLMQDQINHVAMTDDLTDMAEFMFRLIQMVSINESAILRLWAVSVDPSSSRYDLTDSFRIFINDVIGHGDNPALKEFNRKL